MKPRVIVLNERKGAKHRWPGEGRLARACFDGSYEHCCIGCEMLTEGVSAEDMCGFGFPDQQRHGSRLVELWNTEVPDDVLADIQEAASLQKRLTFAGQAAAYLNDIVAARSTPEDRIRAVAGIRILFAWLGSTVGERWIVRHLR